VYKRQEKKYLPKDYTKLPILSGNFGAGNTVNVETLLKIKPDVIFSMGEITQTNIDQANRLQKQVGIPVVQVNVSMDTLPKAYKFVGGLVGESKKGKELGDYCAKALSDVKAKAKKIPANKKLKVYYAEGEKGLNTDPANSPHAELLNICGGKNVADVKNIPGYGRSAVSMEQVIKWNPDVIIVCFDQGFAESQSPYKLIMSDPKWKNLKAVKNKRVYEIPYAPFNWFDRPPSVNRAPGLKWLSHLLYPSTFKYNIKAETKSFYSKFYHRTLSDKEVKEILAKAGPIN
jgi:iron complex transport system substrate-binding protein